MKIYFGNPSSLRVILFLIISSDYIAAQAFFDSDFGRPEFFKIDRPEKNDPPQVSPKPRALTNFDSSQQVTLPKQTNRPNFSKQTDRPTLPKQTERPQTFFESQKHFQTSSKPQERPNHLLNKPVKPQIKPNFQSFDHRFTKPNRPHTKLHDSNNIPPITNTKPASSFHKQSHQFSKSKSIETESNLHQNSQFTISNPRSSFNNRPKEIKGLSNSPFTIHRPHTDQNLAFSRPNKQPVDFSSPNNRPVDFSRPNSRPVDFFRPNSRPVDFSRPNNRPVDFSRPNSRPVEFSRPNSRPVDFSRPNSRPVDFSRPNNRPHDFSSIPSFNTRPKNIKEHTNSPVAIHSPHTHQNLAFSRPSTRPVDFSRPSTRPVDFSIPNKKPHDFSSISSFDTRPKKTKVNIHLPFEIHGPHTDQNLAFSRPNKRPVDFSGISTFDGRPKKTMEHTNSHFKIHGQHTDQNLEFSRPNSRPVDFSSILDNPTTSLVKLPESDDDRTGNRHNRQFTRPSGSGCSTPTGFRRPGEVWFSSGCRRSKCIAFRGHSSIETDHCDTEINNTVYSCIIEVNIKARFPDCCPRYRCNPDNLGNLVDRTFV